ncbi:MAG: MFS transporter [Desulfobacteraceae bacterium]|nr:MFS transporter [Desulfobacteraceae bacterium]
MTGTDKKIFATLFFSIFSAVMGVGIVVPLIPLYAESLGASGLYIGLVFASFSLSRAFLLPLFGRLSDKTGRKLYIFTGLFGYTLVSVAFVCSDTISGLIGIRFFQGIASAMIIPVAHAYIGDITPVNREGLTMGLFNMSMFISLSIGPLAGGMINDALGMDAAFLCMGGLSFIGFLMSLWYLPPIRDESHIGEKNRGPLAMAAILRDRGLYGLFCLRMAYVFCIGVIWCFLPVMSKDFGLSSTAIGILIMLGVFVSGGLQIPMGMVADRVDKRKMATLGGVLVAADILCYQWAGGFWSLFAASLVFGLGGGITMPPLMAMAVIKGGESKAMGSVMSLLTVAHSVGMLLGALSAGLVMDFFDVRYTFAVASIVMMAGTLLFLSCTANLRGLAECPTNTF